MLVKGTKIKIKEDLKIGEFYYMNNSDLFDEVVPLMERYFGKTASIVRFVGNSGYIIDIDDSKWLWTDGMFDVVEDLGTFKKYRRINIAEMAPFVPGMDLKRVSISKSDEENGSPKEGDMIARNPLNHDDKWLVAEKYFKENFELYE